MEQACLLGVAALTAGVYLNTSTSSKQGDSDNKSDSEGEQRRALRRLQRVYLPAHLLALFSDWLQGPYVFQLYRDYGYSEQVLYCTILIVLHCTVLCREQEIALLFLAGYLSSCVFGGLTGPLADKYGRRRLGQV